MIKSYQGDIAGMTGDNIMRRFNHEVLNTETMQDEVVEVLMPTKMCSVVTNYAFTAGLTVDIRRAPEGYEVHARRNGKTVDLFQKMARKDAIHHAARWICK